MHLLGAEREGVTDNESLLPWLLDTWHRRRHQPTVDRVHRDRVASAYVFNEASRLLALRAKHSPRREGPDALAPLVKLSRNLVDQETANLVVDLLGADGALGGDYDWGTRGPAPNDQMRFLWTRETTIGGGTVQILRNVIGERLLGLPSDVRADKDLPWRQVPRS
jgi:alkylation response protein AidB-like acyl-CoA dehydrogenase